MSAWLELLRRKRLVILGAAVSFLLGGWVLWGLFAPHPDPYVEAIRKRGYPVSPAELEAFYPPVPPEENAALTYVKALSLLPNSSGPITNFMGLGWLPPIGQRLSAEDQTRLQSALAENQAALRLLCSVPASGRSRYPIRLEDGFGASWLHLQRMEQAMSLLTAQGVMQASQGDAEKATLAFLAAGRLADSVAEEPMIYSQIVRCRNWGILLPCLERVLSLTAFSEAQLASLQRIVECAERPRAAHRAWVWEQTCALEVFTDTKVRERGYWAEGSLLPPVIRLDFATHLAFFRFSGLLRKNEASYCERMNRHLAAWELPYPERFNACRQLAALPRRPGYSEYFFQSLLPNLGRMYVLDADHTALVRVATTALAIERFRLAHGNHLPVSLEQLVPDSCKAMPIDPIDGKPLRYRTHGGSYAVYSIGSNDRDDGGVAWDSERLKVPQDVSFVVKH